MASKMKDQLDTQLCSGHLMSWEITETMKMLLFILAETLRAFHIYLGCETHSELTHPLNRVYFFNLKFDYILFSVLNFYKHLESYVASTFKFAAFLSPQLPAFC